MDLRFSYLLAIFACGIFCKNIPLRFIRSDIDRINGSHGKPAKGLQALVTDDTKTVNFYKLPNAAFVVAVRAKNSYTFNSIKFDRDEILYPKYGYVTDAVTWEYWGQTNFIYFDVVDAGKNVRLVFFKKNGGLWKRMTWENFVTLEYQHKPSVTLQYKQDPKTDGITYKENLGEPDDHSITTIDRFLLVKRIVEGDRIVYDADASVKERILDVFTTKFDVDLVRIKTLDRFGTTTHKYRKRVSIGWTSGVSSMDKHILWTAICRVEDKQDEAADTVTPVYNNADSLDCTTKPTLTENTVESKAAVKQPETRAIQLTRLDKYKDVKHVSEKLQSGRRVEHILLDGALYNQLEIYGKPFIKSSVCGQLKTLYIENLDDFVATVTICEDKEKQLRRHFIMMKHNYPYVASEGFYVAEVLKRRHATDIHTSTMPNDIGARVYEAEDESGRYTAVEPQVFVVTGKLVDMKDITICDMKDISKVALLLRAKIYTHSQPWRSIIEYSDNGLEKKLYLEKSGKEWVVMNPEEVKAWFPSATLDQLNMSPLHEQKDKCEVCTNNIPAIEAVGNNDKAVPSTLEENEESHKGTVGDATETVQTSNVPLGDASNGNDQATTKEPEDAVQPDKTYDALVVVSDELDNEESADVQKSDLSSNIGDEEVIEPIAIEEPLEFITNPIYRKKTPSRQNSSSSAKDSEESDNIYLSAEDLLSIEKTPSIRGGNVQAEEIPVDESPDRLEAEKELEEENGFTFAGVTSMVLGSFGLLVLVF